MSSSIETPRLLLRLPEETDAERLMIIHHDPEVLEKKQVTRLAAPSSGIEVGLSNVRRMLRQWNERGFGQWSVVETSSAEVIGCVGFYYQENWPGIDLGWIFHRERWGHGFATEASAAALAWAWNANLDHIISLIGPNDLRSIRVATKIGETFERADVDPVHGEPVHVYGIYRPVTNLMTPKM